MSLQDLSSWQSRAACRGEDLDLFFGPDSERGEGRENPEAKRRRESRAKLICYRCPVRFECLDHAISRNDKWGIWGGLNEDESASERRKRQRRARAA